MATLQFQANVNYVTWTIDFDEMDIMLLVPIYV